MPRVDIKTLERRKRARYAAAAAVMAVATILPIFGQTTPLPMYTSILTGALWFSELWDGHPTRFRNQFGMSQDCFARLSVELQLFHRLAPSKHLGVDEQLGIFLYFMRTGSSSRILQERFQRSADTISRYIHKLLNMIVCGPFYDKYVKLPQPETPPEIFENPKLHPYFDKCLGAIDGSYIDAYVPSDPDAAARYRNRKGRLSMNILAACSFDMRYLYVLSGWEGSAADGQIYNDARATNFYIPEGYFYLGDAGFGLCDSVLVPYRNTCYHLREWEQVGKRPSTKQELFNLRHSQARNVVERIFGVDKRQFSVLRAIPEYDLITQAKIPCAMAALHNFILKYDADWEAEEIDQDNGLINADQQPDERELAAYISAEESDRASAWRDDIADQMWTGYQWELARRN